MNSSERAGAAAAALAITLVATPLAFVAWYSGTRRLGVERAGLFAGVIPVTALLSVALVGTSTISAPKLAGSVLVAGGIVAGLRQPSSDQAGVEL
ncbi:MAG TPA: hypothetical protein VFA45_07000 [Actinomycetes bacterium]|jgi:drug/metabolite transporter (DMT)-like permease|nr:hypothetical protein [Actinomycetes bacterium]